MIKIQITKTALMVAGAVVLNFEHSDFHRNSIVSLGS